MNLFAKLIAANLGSIAFLCFTVWALKNDHMYFAIAAFIIAVLAGRTLETKNK